MIEERPTTVHIMCYTLFLIALAVVVFAMASSSIVTIQITLMIILLGAFIGFAIYAVKRLQRDLT